MLKGCDLNELQARITQAEAAKHDMVVPTTDLQVGGNETGVYLKAGASWYKTGEVAQDNLATLAQIPQAHFRKLVARNPVEAARHMTVQLKDLAEELPRQRMVRTIGDRARAVLSDKFLRLDHQLALSVALPQIQDAGAEIKSVLVTVKRMAIQFVFPRVAGEVRVGDVVQMGGILWNSEVGLGRFALEEILFRLRCLNGMMALEAQGGYSRRHVTRRQGVELVTLDREALVDMMGQEMAQLLSPDAFERQLALSHRAAAVTLDEALLPRAMKQVTGLGLTQDEGESVMGEYLDGQDCSIWGLANAVTFQAHAATPERSLELERIGGNVITLPPSAWKAI